MARATRSTNTTTAAHKPGIMSRLRGRTQPARVTESTSRNPVTGTTTTTRKTQTHPKGVGHHGHGGQGPLASKHHNTTTGKHTTTTGRTAATGTARSSATTTGTHHRRKPSMGDKVSGAMMKLKGSLTHKPGVKAAGTRRMHGTDGKGSHRAY